jgi:hypothetical protein
MYAPDLEHAEACFLNLADSKTSTHLACAIRRITNRYTIRTRSTICIAVLARRDKSIAAVGEPTSSGPTRAFIVIHIIVVIAFLASDNIQIAIAAGLV